MREIKLRKEKRPQYAPMENQKSQKIGNRDIPLGGPTTIKDSTSYGRNKGIIALPEPRYPSKKEQKEAKKKERESGDALKKVREELDKDFYKPLNPKKP